MGHSRDMQDNHICLIQGHELDMYQELISPSSTRSSRGMMFEVNCYLVATSLWHVTSLARAVG